MSEFKFVSVQSSDNAMQRIEKMGGCSGDGREFGGRWMRVGKDVRIEEGKARRWWVRSELSRIPSLERYLELPAN